MTRQLWHEHAKSDIQLFRCQFYSWRYSRPGWEIVVLWRHANTYCVIILTNCPQTVSKLFTCERPCLIRPKTDLDFKIRIPKQNVKSQTVSWKQMKNPDIVLSLCRNLSVLFKQILSECHCFASITFYCQIMGQLIKRIVWSFHWHLLIAVRHLESSESASGAGFIVSQIQIRFQKNLPKQTQRILKTIFDFGVIKQGINYRVKFTVFSLASM